MNKIEILTISALVCVGIVHRVKWSKAWRECERISEDLQNARIECAELREKFAQASAARDANEAIITQLSVALSSANGEKTVLAARLKEAA